MACEKAVRRAGESGLGSDWRVAQRSWWDMYSQPAGLGYVRPFWLGGGLVLASAVCA